MNITTIEELKKHIGEFLAFESHSGSKHRTYVWIQKLQRVGEKINSIPLGETEIYHLPCYSLFSAEVYPNLKPYSGIEIYPKLEPYSGICQNESIYDLYHTNAQCIIRTPTKEEMKKYMMMWRKIKILGRY